MQGYLAREDGFLHPRAAGLNFSKTVDEAGYAGVAATGYVTAQLNCAQAGIAEVLPVAGSIAPPGVVGYDGQGPGSFAYIAGAVFSVYGFL